MREEVLGAGSLAVRILGVGQLLAADDGAESDRGDDERDPAESGRLPVRGAPAARACCEIRVHFASQAGG